MSQYEPLLMKFAGLKIIRTFAESFGDTNCKRYGISAPTEVPYFLETEPKVYFTHEGGLRSPECLIQQLVETK